MKITKLSVCVSMVGLLATLPAAYANEIVTNCTQVTAAGAEDLDSTPNNMVGPTVVEDDESCVTVTIPFDYGDAPDPSYQTLNASGGARHQLGTDVFLGQCVDGDSGVLQGAASADDEDAGSPTYGNCTTSDDEDGVTFGELHVASTASTIEVIASQDCKLNAWIDWNIDGSWGGAAEQVFLNQQLSAGTNTLSLAVPAFALAGDTYARFRCSTEGNDGIGGEAADGEVEDYKVSVLEAVPVKQVSVGDYVWIDANENGQQDEGELPLEGAIVTLYNADGSVVVQNDLALSVSIGADGYYLFDNLSEGDYIVRVQPPEGYQVTTGGADVDDDPSNTDNNCKVVGSNIQTLPFTLASGSEPDTAADGNGMDSNLTVDCGFYKPKVEPGAVVAVGNRIWVDANGNGVQDEDEAGLEGAVVTLTDSTGAAVTDADGNAVVAQTTGTDGLYAFSNLLEGDYIISVEPPKNYYLTVGGIDVDDDNSDKDSNCRVNSQTGAIDTYPFNLTAGMAPDSTTDGDDANSNMTVDCGFYSPVSIGDKVWLDNDADGQQDSDEGGISGVTVSLVEDDGLTPATDVNGSQVVAVITDANGNYLFSNLMPGNYVVVVDPGKDSGYSLTRGGADPDADASNTDSNCKIVGDTLQTPAVTLVAGTEPDTDVDGDDTSSNRTVDCGLYRSVKLGGRVWIDLDGNGRQDGGEPSIPGALVILLREDGTPAVDIFGNAIEPQTTTADGSYLFDNLPEGAFVIKITPPLGYLPTVVVADPNNNDGTDSNGLATEDGSVISQPINLKWGEEPDDGGATNTSLGFGFVPNLQVPTLSQWGVVLLSMLLATAAFFRRRRQDCRINHD